MRAKPVLALLPALVLLGGCEFEDIGSFGRYHEDFHYNYPLKTGGRLAIESFNGTVEISPWDQENLDISGTKYARSPEEAREIRIEIDHTRDAAAIRAIRPFSTHGNYGARFAIKVPRSVVMDRVVTSNGAIRVSEGAGPARFKSSNGGIHVLNFRGELYVETSNGPLELTGIEGSVTGHTSNSGIRAEDVRGGLDVSTSNGTVRVKLDRSEGTVKVGTSNSSIDLTLPNGPVPAVRAHTSNGGITVHLPADANARLEASTSNGSITSDFEMRMRGEFSKHHLAGSLGNGGSLIDLSTSNASIRVVR